MNIFRHVACAISLGSFILGTASLHAQAGGPGADTPTGLSGGFGGTIETGAGTFDPYEQNSSRSVTDVVVPGAVTWHSRSKTWRSNWSWGISIWETNEYGPGGEPSDMFKGYIATYPDGRVVQFAKPANAPNGGPGTYVPRTGLPDRFVIHANGGSQLLLSDGSVINFTNGLTSVVNPLGQTVTISYSATTGTLIQEPAGRWIRIGPTQGSGTNNQTTVLTTSAGQSVTYTYNHHVSGFYPHRPTSIKNPPPGYQPPDPNGPSINTSTQTVTTMTSSILPRTSRSRRNISTSRCNHLKSPLTVTQALQSLIPSTGWSGLLIRCSRGRSSRSNMSMWIAPSTPMAMRIAQPCWRSAPQPV